MRLKVDVTIFVLLVTLFNSFCALVAVDAVLAFLEKTPVVFTGLQEDARGVLIILPLKAVLFGIGLTALAVKEVRSTFFLRNSTANR